MNGQINYVTQDSLAALNREHADLRNLKIPEIAKRIDDAKQQGDLSENAEYTQAREEMSWAQGRLQELDQILANVELIKPQLTGLVGVGSSLTVKVSGQNKDYTIVGPQEINPAKGFISNESPLGEAFIGHKKGDEVTVSVPSGKVTYKIVDIK